MEQHPKLAKIRALLAKAEGTQFEAEAEAYRETALRMMAEYGVEEAMLNEYRPEGSKEEVESRRIEVVGSYALSKAQFYQSVIKAMGGRAVRMVNQRGASKQVIMAYGYPSDLLRAEVLWTSILLQLGTALKNADRPWHVNDRGSIRAFNNAFVIGYFDRVGDRIQEREDRTRQQASQEPTQGTSTELVLVNRQLAVNNQFEKAHPKIRYSQRSTQSPMGFGAGRREGNRANIGGTGLGRAGQRALT